jgi:hypothetical protein
MEEQKNLHQQKWVNFGLHLWETANGKYLIGIIFILLEFIINVRSTGVN